MSRRAEAEMLASRSIVSSHKFRSVYSKSGQTWKVWVAGAVVAVGVIGTVVSHSGFDALVRFRSWASNERELLGRLEGPVLDLAAGAGSYTLYLQSLGLDVTAAEHSAGAMELCRARGCRKVVPADLRALALEAGVFGSIIVMGNTLGAHQTPETMPGLLRTLRRALKPAGRLLFTMIDPLDTADEGHLQYQRQKRAQGRPPGLIRMRITYDGVSEPWMHLWMLTDEELLKLASETGWVLIEERRGGPLRTRLWESKAS